jgi:cob(I)alamin adenosyltransferase
MSESSKKAAESVFNEPRIVITRVYTKKGDTGETALVGGQRVAKDDARIEAYGTVDELNAFVGLARESVLASLGTVAPEHVPAAEELARTLLRVQHELFNLGSILATLPADVHPKQPRITEVEVTALERDLDDAQAALPKLRSFVLPGGCRLNAELHVARTVCRRAERLTVALARTTPVDPLAVIYLNRLSDAFFVWSRRASQILGAREIVWQPNEAASGQTVG